MRLRDLARASDLPNHLANTRLYVAQILGKVAC